MNCGRSTRRVLAIAAKYAINMHPEKLKIAIKGVKSIEKCCGLVLAVGLLALSATKSLGQGTAADYERARNLGKLTANKVFRDKVQPHWLPGNRQFWYQVKTGPDTHEFVLVDAVKGERKPAFDHERLADALAKVGVKDVRAGRLPLELLTLKPDEKAAEFRAGGKNWRADLATYSLRELPATAISEPAAKPTGELPRASRRTGEETSITFVNKTGGEVEIIWLDTEGQRHSYGRLKAGEERRQHTYAGHAWLVVDGNGKPLAGVVAGEQPERCEVDGKTALQAPAPRETRRKTVPKNTSPDGRWQAFIKDFNVWLRDMQTKEEVQLSTDGHTNDFYGERFYWSPDSKKLVAVRTQRGEERKVYLIESSPADQLQPKLHSIDYPKPGDRIAKDQPQLFDIASRKHVPVSNELFDNPWSITDLRWEPDSRRFTFLYNQRGHQVLRIVAVDAQTGAARPIVEEKSQTFINYSGNLYVQYLDQTGEIIWMSERDGWNHLYLYDAKSGSVKNQITKGEWVVRGVERVDAEKRQIWFRAGGILPGQDPYYVHYARVGFDGSGLTVLTEGNGTHSIQYSPDGEYFIDTYSRVDMPPVNELRRTADGKLVCLLERGDHSALLKTGWRPPEPFVAKGRDGQTDIYGIIIRPTNFNPQKKYPVIEHIYAGPQGAFVPKSFSVSSRMMELAELGFILVQIDGMGTAYRSKKFHDVCWKNLGDGGFPDRILWIKAAAAKYPQMDISRVGIYGGSAGGQNALRALLAHGDFYKAAAADCGCHDNRMDKIWWNEQWMGWPVGPHYAEQSNVTQAHKLQGKLLLTVGELDKNVDPSSTMQVVNALIKANKDFELIVFPGAGHGAGGSPYGWRRMQDFFVRNLLGVEPRL